MNISDLYHRTINLPSTTGLKSALAVAVAILIISGLLLSFGKLRDFARALGIVALLLIMAVLFDIEKQSVTEQQGPAIAVTRPRYSERTRWLARAGLVAIPAAGVAVMAAVWVVNRRWLRSQVPRYLKAGRKHFYKQEYEAALLQYNQAIETAPHLGEAYCRRGCVFQAMGDTPRALADFDQAIQSDPRLGKAYLERAKIRTESGDLESALADFDRLLAIRAEDAEVYLGRGVCFMKKGQLEDAAADFRRVLKLTNHTDFADPAKKYLLQLEQQHSPDPLGTPNRDGPAPAPAATEPKPQNYAV